MSEASKDLLQTMWFNLPGPILNKATLLGYSYMDDSLPGKCLCCFIETFMRYRLCRVDGKDLNVS